jgi:phosphatidylinositol 4-kinase
MWSSCSQVDVFASLLHKSLPIAVGKPAGGGGTISHDIAAVGARFRLLNIGMALLQGDILPSTMAKSALRERVYATTLDYFAQLPMFPAESATTDGLHDDIAALVKFWHSVHSDKKYLKDSNVAFGDVGTDLNLTTSGGTLTTADTSSRNDLTLTKSQQQVCHSHFESRYSVE